MVRIGALTTHAELAASAVLREQCPALAEAAGTSAIRRCATAARSAATWRMPTPRPICRRYSTALGARFVVTSGRGQQTIAVDQFFTGMMATALGEHDLLTAIEVPAKAAGQGSAYVKFEHPASRYAVIGVAAVLTVSGGTCTSAAVAVGGLVPRPTRAPSVERALSGQALIRMPPSPAPLPSGRRSRRRHHRRPLCLGRVPARPSRRSG